MEMQKYYTCDDIQLVPHYASLLSRSECNPAVTVGGVEYSIPLIASCMDTVYSRELDEYLSEEKILCMVHRYFENAEKQYKHAGMPPDSPYRFFAVGNDKKWIEYLLEQGIRHFVVDMAHGDSYICVNTVEFILQECPEAKVIAGNIATRSGFNRLQDAGAFGVRCGIGCGCFTPDTLVNTDKGMKKICDIQIGDRVYTHTGQLKDVIGLIKYKTNEKIVEINDEINCTQNHEFLVIHKKYKNIVNETNYLQYAEWIRADELTGDYFMLELE